MKQLLLLLVLPAQPVHAAQISAEVTHTGHLDARWMRSQASMREEDQWRPSEQAAFPRPSGYASYGPSWNSGWGSAAASGQRHHSWGFPTQAVWDQATPSAAVAAAAAPSGPSPAVRSSPASPASPASPVSSAPSARGPGGPGPSNIQEAEAETKKFFEIEAMVARETGLPVNSSEAAQEEAEKKAEAKDAEEDEEAERFDALYAGMVLVVLLAAGGTFYYYRRSQQLQKDLDKLKLGEAPAIPASSPEATAAPGS